MIELSQGRSVKWQHNGAWFTGYVLCMDDISVSLGGDLVLVRHSNTNTDYVVRESRLQPNDFRKAEKLAEQADKAKEDAETIEWLEGCIKSLEVHAQHYQEAGAFLATAKGYRDGYKAGIVGIETINDFADFIDSIYHGDDESEVAK